MTPNKSKLKTIIRDILLEADKEDRWEKADAIAKKIIKVIEKYITNKEE